LERQSEGATKYLCLIYEDETLRQKMPKAEAEQVYGDYFAFTEGIRKSGHYIGGNPLQPTSTATTVRVRNGKVSTTDGPFAETKEQLTSAVYPTTLHRRACGAQTVMAGESARAWLR
jgi:hypothetical protein